MTALVEHLMDAQAVNAVQDRTFYDPSPETDSMAEHLAAILRTATPEQRPHAEALLRMLGDVRRLNRVERQAELAAAACADPVTSVHEFVKLARPLLADVAHPFVGSDKRRERRTELHALFARTHARTRSSVSARQLLGVSKYTTLLNELALWGMPAAVEATEGRESVSVADLGVTA